jgi:hypothetical protein
MVAHLPAPGHAAFGLKAAQVLEQGDALPDEVAANLLQILVV